MMESMVSVEDYMAIAADPPLQTLNQMEAMLRAGHFAKLEEMAGKLTRQYPRSVPVWELLGLSLKYQGGNALHAFRNVVKLRPEDAEAYFNLGTVQQGQGLLEEAADSYRQVIRLKPDHVGAYNNLGNTLGDLGRHGEAIEYIRQAVRISPNVPLLHNNLGNAFRKIGQLEDAMASFRRALELEPGFVMASINLANTLNEAGRADEAIGIFQNALRISPSAPGLHSNLGGIFMQCGKLDEAMACYRRSLELDPRSAQTLIDISHLHMIAGRKDEAERTIEKAIEIDPNDPVAYFIHGRAARTKREDSYFRKLVSLEEGVRSGQRSMPWQKMIFMHYALGKCFDDLGEYDQAFRYFKEGGRLKRASISYDPEWMTQYFNDVIRAFDHATMARLHSAGHPSEVPVFVLGMPRSGTTLVEQIIASHPDAHGAGELADLLNMSKRIIAGKKFPANIQSLDRDLLSRWGEEYTAALRNHAPEAKRIINKMPDNFHIIGLIRLMLPNARIIHVKRDPVDTCLSCYTTLFSGALNHSYDLAELGRYYLDYLRLMEHWRRVMPAGTFLEMQYEDIVADQETQTRRIIDYCGLEWDDACLDFHKSGRSVGTASVAQVRQPIYRSSVERWRSYEKHLGPLLDVLRQNDVIQGAKPGGHEI